MSLEGEERAAHHLAPPGARVRGRPAALADNTSPEPQAGYKVLLAIRSLPSPAVPEWNATVANGALTVAFGA
jgi:hypothetical protein